MKENVMSSKTINIVQTNKQMETPCHVITLLLSPKSFKRSSSKEFFVLFYYTPKILIDVTFCLLFLYLRTAHALFSYRSRIPKINEVI